MLFMYHYILLTSYLISHDILLAKKLTSVQMQLNTDPTNNMLQNNIVMTIVYKIFFSHKIIFSLQKFAYKFIIVYKIFFSLFINFVIYVYSKKTKQFHLICKSQINCHHYRKNCAFDIVSNSIYWLLATCIILLHA
jgi:hypothetical protein